MTKKLPKRVKNALDKISCSDLYNYYDTGNFVELVVDRWGDCVTYRVYDNGEISVK